MELPVLGRYISHISPSYGAKHSKTTPYGAKHSNATLTRRCRARTQKEEDEKARIKAEEEDNIQKAIEYKSCRAQGYLAHKKQHPPPESP